MPAPHTVLLVIPNLQQGGAERQILELRNRLPERFAPTLCVFEGTSHYAEYLPAGEPRHNLGIGRMTWAGLGRLRAVLREVKPTILHSYRDSANLWARVAASVEPVPVVIASYRTRFISPLSLASEPILSRRTDRVLTNSLGTRRELVSVARLRPTDVQVIHNFIDTDKFRPPTEGQRRAARAHYGLEPDDIALILPGRISWQKHQLGLALSLYHLKRSGRLSPNIRVFLAGRDHDTIVVRTLPAVLSLFGVSGSIERLGSVGDMITLYHAGDALLMPSLFEGLPNAVLEAHACGLPAVVSHAANIDGLVVHGETGYEVPTFAGRQFAEATARICAMSHQERRQMGQRGRDHVARTFSVERVLQETVSLYDTLLADKGLR